MHEDMLEEAHVSESSKHFLWLVWKIQAVCLLKSKFLVEYFNSKLSDFLEGCVMHSSFFPFQTVMSELACLLFNLNWLLYSQKCVYIVVLSASFFIPVPP